MGGLHSNDGQEEERIIALHLQYFSILNFSFRNQVFLLKLPGSLLSSVGRHPIRLCPRCSGVPAWGPLLRVTPPLTQPVFCHILRGSVNTNNKSQRPKVKRKSLLGLFTSSKVLPIMKEIETCRGTRAQTRPLVGSYTDSATPMIKVPPTQVAATRNRQRWKSYCLKCLTKETYDTLKLSGKKYSGKSFVCVILGEKEIIFKRKTFIF